MNLGIVQAALLKNVSSEASYLMALKHRKKYPDCYYNLGNLVITLLNTEYATLPSMPSKAPINTFANTTHQNVGY